MFIHTAFYTTTLTLDELNPKSDKRCICNLYVSPSHTNNGAAANYTVYFVRQKSRQRIAVEWHASEYLNYNLILQLKHFADNYE